MSHFDVLIVGGGASGLLAALVAKDYGANVAILEGQNRIAKKILTTGNGRCNFTNSGIKPPYDTFHSSNLGFYTDVLNQLTVKETIELFNTYGLHFTTLEKNKMYPQSLQASSVVDLFRLNLEERDIPVFLETKVLKIDIQNELFKIETTNQEYSQFTCKKLLIACGGNAAPETGSDGSIYSIVSRLGHQIIEPRPSIVQLKLDYPHLKAISGVRLDALASAIVNDKVIKKDLEEIIFTDYGISGTAIFNLSRAASQGLYKKDKVIIALDLFYKLSLKEVQEFFENHFALFPHRSIHNALVGILNKKLIPIILKEAGISDIHKICDQLNYPEKNNLYKLFKEWKFKCVDTNGLKFAQTTIGGVDTRDVNPQTLESKIVKNLYFSGEVLDVDGDCGGFNLQWAWSSGYVAAINISN